MASDLESRVLEILTNAGIDAGYTPAEIANLVRSQEADVSAALAQLETEVGPIRIAAGGKPGPRPALPITTSCR